MSTGFDDGDTLLEAYLAQSGEADLGETHPPRRWEDGREVGDWTVTGFLARGGNAEVYCAKHRRLGTRAALKVLWRDEDGPRVRFDRETRFLMENRLPSFPAFLGAGKEDGRPWVAMELLDECPLPETDTAVARYLEDVGRAVAALHARGWLHRDLKPRNILRRADGHAVLADFGLLKAIADNVTAVAPDSPSVVAGREVGVGTPGYSAPEQFTGTGATVAADVYALGMLAEECFGGHPPRPWERIIRRATAALPRQRYADVATLLRAIHRRHWPRSATAAIVLTVPLAILFAWGWHPKPPPPEVPIVPSVPEVPEVPSSPSPGSSAEQAREAAVRRASTGPDREVVEGIIRDMVILEGAEALDNPMRESLGTPSGPVLVARHEVTQAQWMALMDANPSRFQGPDRPVDGVTIGDCLEFIGRLNRMPDVREAALRFRLPIAAEWTLAAGATPLARQRDYWHSLAMAAGNPDAADLPANPDSSFGNAWFAENSGNETHPVGQLPPGERGLFDAYGNVAELAFAVTKLKQTTDSSRHATALRCLGGSCIQPRNDSDTPVLLTSLGGEIETLPEEWQPVIHSVGISPSSVPASSDSAPSATLAGHAVVGLRLFADREKPTGDRMDPTQGR
jgi:serine/threonine protein kinase